MKIAYVGNFTQDHCTEVHIAKTLEKLGHVVYRLQENGIRPDELTNIIAQMDFDLFLYTRTWGETVTLEHLAQLRERQIPSASYHLDLYVGLSRKYLHGDNTLETMLQNDPFWRTDYVFTPDGDPESQKVFEANGVNHIYQRAGVFEDECEIIKSPELGSDGFYHELVFVGGGDRVGSPDGYGHPEWQYRNELITWLHDNYSDKFHKFGHPQRTIRSSENDLALNRLYGDTKVVVGDSVCIDFKHTEYWSDRVYETIGRGGFLIHPYVKGLDDEFTDGETIVFYEYGNFDQLKEKINYYLAHDEEREKIRIAGFQKVKNNYTYTHRLRRMLNIIEETEKASEAINKADSEAKYKSGDDIKINLGAGSEPTDGWVNVDWLEMPQIDIVQNLLLYPWEAFADNCASEIKAIDVLEHMPNYTPDNEATPIAFVEECHRILKAGGKLTIQVPHYLSPNLWIDPTHVRGYDPKSMDYFDPSKDLGKWYGYYSDKKFKVSAEVSKMADGQPSNVTFTMVKIGS